MRTVTPVLNPAALSHLQEKLSAEVEVAGGISRCSSVGNLTGTSATAGRSVNTEE